MTGLEVIGWAGIAAASIVIVSVGAAFARIFWQAADSKSGSSVVFKGKNS